MERNSFGLGWIDNLNFMGTTQPYKRDESSKTRSGMRQSRRAPTPALPLLSSLPSSLNNPGCLPRALDDGWLHQKYLIGNRLHKIKCGFIVMIVANVICMRYVAILDGQSNEILVCFYCTSFC